MKTNKVNRYGGVEPDAKAVDVRVRRFEAYSRQQMARAPPRATPPVRGRPLAPVEMLGLLVSPKRMDCTLERNVRFVKIVEALWNSFDKLDITWIERKPLASETLILEVPVQSPLPFC